MDSHFFTQHKWVFAGIISAVGSVSCSTIVFISWLRTRIYVYDYSTTMWLNELLHVGRGVGIVIIFLGIILALALIEAHSKKEAILLIIFCLIFSISVYSSYSLSGTNNTLFTLTDPVVISKLDGEDIVVQSSNRDDPVIIKCTESEYNLFTIGHQYGGLVYTGDNEGGILQYIEDIK